MEYIINYLSTVLLSSEQCHDDTFLQRFTTNHNGLVYMFVSSFYDRHRLILTCFSLRCAFQGHVYRADMISFFLFLFSFCIVYVCLSPFTM